MKVGAARGEGSGDSEEHNALPSEERVCGDSRGLEVFIQDKEFHIWNLIAYGDDRGHDGGGRVTSSTQKLLSSHASHRPPLSGS